MNTKQRGHVYPEITIFVAVLLILLAIGVPYLARGQWVVGGLWLLPVVVLIGFAVRAWIRHR